MDNKFISPAYKTRKISIFDIIAQKVNPNSITGKSFSALQQSIFNTGYTIPIVIIENPTYEKESDTLDRFDKLELAIFGKEGDPTSGYGAHQFVSSISDENIRKMFKYRVVDGQQRSSIIRLGSKYYIEDKEDGNKKWENKENWPMEPGREMLKFIAWRENFTIPCSILEGLDEVQLLSSTVLMNSARGSHRFEAIKDIVYDLINISGMSKEWVSRNLFLDIDSVKRILQLKGLKSAFDDIDNCGLSWNPETDEIYKQKLKWYIIREAKIYLRDYMKEDEIKYLKEDPRDVAEKYGWDRKLAEKSVKLTDMEFAPNGTRRDGTLHNNFIPEFDDSI